MPANTGRRLAALALGGLLIAQPALAGGPGTSAATFLQLGYGARPVGLGEAFVSVANDVSALYYNPAGLAYPAAYDARARAAGGYEVLAAQSLLVQDIQMTQLGFVTRPFGLNVTYLNLGGIEQRTSETDAPDGRFGASDMSIGLSAAHQFGGVGLGATLKFVRETIGVNSASAYAVDFGALRRMESRPISLGVDVMNLGTGLRFVDQTYPLPAALRAGVTYGLTQSFPHALTLQVDLPRDSSPVVRFGVEYLGFGPIALRAGYRTYGGDQRAAALGKALGTTASGISDFYGMFMGAGFRSPIGTIDYALVPYGELGTAHRFSFTMNFGGGAKKAPAAARIYAP